MSEQNMAGIYGIYIDDELVYVGSTANFFKRAEYHQECITNRIITKKYTEFRKALAAGKKVVMRPLLDLYECSLSYKTCITRNELECMELAYITAMRPRLNTAGTLTNFSFSENGNDIVYVCRYWTDDWKKPVRDVKKWQYDFELGTF